MAKRNPVSGIQNIWFDSEQVDAEDLIVEQDYNNTIDSSIINNHIGSGILPFDLENRVLFDTESQALQNNPELDGLYLTASEQPSDNNFGNQLEIELSKSSSTGRRTIKIAIIGLDFEQNLQYETFVFKTNESQVTKKHYTSVLQILINDFKGTSTQSLNLGGRIVIREASPFALSRSTMPLAQNVEPNLFWRDFFVPSSVGNLSDLLKLGLSNYDIKELNILESSSKSPIKFNSGNVTQQVGQKFKANVNNIQKITLLLSATNEGSVPTNYNWTGNILVSIYPLQTTLQCPTDLPPETLLGYPPSPAPLAQISVDIDSLRAKGIVLDSVAQPVDFIFSNTSVATSNVIVPGNYYAFTIKRATGPSGDTSVGEIYVHAGGKYVADSVKTMLDANGLITSSNDWVDDPQSDLWFEIHSSAAKVTDGQAYISGNGVILEKTIYDDGTASTIDYCLDNLYFAGSDKFTATVFAGNEKTTPVQDLRTGNLVYSRQKNVPEVKLLSTIDLQSIEDSSDPLLIGSITDKNTKYFDNSVTSAFTYNLKTFSFFKNEIIIKIDDTESRDLQSRFLRGELVNSKIYSPTNPSAHYVISSAEIITAKYGNVESGPSIDEDDLLALRSFVGFNLNKTPELNSQITLSPALNPTSITWVNGYNTYSNKFISGLASYYIVSSIDNSVIRQLATEQLSIDPEDTNPRRALLEVTYTSVPVPSAGFVGNYVVIRNNSNESNNGGFKIVAIKEIISNLTETKYILVIEKILLDKDNVIKIFQSDLDGDLEISNAAGKDESILQAYIDKSAFVPPVAPTPVGQDLSVLRLVIEKRLSDDVMDRNDDYFTSLSSRASSIHKLPDLAIENGVFLGNTDLSSTPIALSFEKQQYWEDYLVTSNTKTKYVSAIFNQSEDVQIYSQEVNGISVQTFNSKPSFDPGRIDSFISDNIILGDGAEIVRGDGSLYKVDFEIGTIVLEIPPGTFTSEFESSIDIFNDFIKNNSDGTTTIGFPAMRFADGSFVEEGALEKNQLRFSASIQSLSKDNTKINSKLGVSIDYETGLMHIIFNELFRDMSQELLSTRIQISVFLKKGGFNNKDLYVDYSKMANISRISTINSDGSIGGSLVYKNPYYVYGFTGIRNFTAIHTDENIGALTFNLSDIISGATAIYFEVIAKGDVSTTTSVSLKHVNDNGSMTNISTINSMEIEAKPILFKSLNLLDIISESYSEDKDHVYEIYSTSTSSDSVTYQSCRLAVYY